MNKDFLTPDILDKIGHYFGSITSLKLILGVKINKDHVFREGGLGVVLEKILMKYPDRYTLTTMKTYITHKEVPLVKAVLTRNMSILSLVSEIWRSTHSDFAYVKAVETGFVDALDFIGHDIPRPNAQLLNMFIINSKSKDSYDKIDLTNKEPLLYVASDKEYLSSYSRKDFSGKKRVAKFYVHNGYTEEFVKESHIMEVVQYYHEVDDLEKAMSWLRRIEEEMCIDDFFKIVTGMRDVRILEGLNDRFALNELQMEIHIAFMEEDIKKIEELYLSYPQKILYEGKEYYWDVLPMCTNIKTIDEKKEAKREERKKPEKKAKQKTTKGGKKKEIKKKKEKLPTRNDTDDDRSKDINHFIKEDRPSNQLKEVRRFAENNGKGSINNITKRVYLYGREDVIWFCNICMDLGYKAVKEEKLDTAYMENKTIHYPSLNLKVKKNPYCCNYEAVGSADDKYRCLLDLAINYSFHFASLQVI